jgi:hypothetical protein
VTGIKANKAGNMEWKQLGCKCTPLSFHVLDNSASGVIVCVSVFVIISHLLTDAICHAEAELCWTAEHPLGCGASLLCAALILRVACAYLFPVTSRGKAKRPSCSAR